MPQAAYMPVRITYEADAEVLVTQYRNVETGEVRTQIPAPAILESYRSRAALGLPPHGVGPQDGSQQDAEKPAIEPITGKGKGEDTPPQTDAAPVGPDPVTGGAPATPATPTTATADSIPSVAPALQRVQMSA